MIEIEINTSELVAVLKQAKKESSCRPLMADLA
ncbi:Uncharacterised protein [Neisseria animalis]|nr:Uncharacterised protein [Neisseria animalis]